MLFLVKLLLLSALISLGIKYIGPVLKIAPNDLNALLGVLIFPLFMTGVLWWRGSRKIESQG
ncbi:MAG: hypothetical protein N5P05_002181 [Chroococcopsis gigantea SAG 12.99]|jgi:hypothetical protein|nr:hypothetical protein [Chlorogloea purpurea SAG 13.99]MDV3000575.1 hypothetical protein [Chroococcopsis gigantea SAG 12.99]